MLELQEDNARTNTTEKAGSGPVSATTCGPAATAAIATAATGPQEPDFVRIIEGDRAAVVQQEVYSCAVCGEPARGFHFGAFTCEGCKSFFGRTCLRKNHDRFECKNAGRCDVVGSNRTSCKACRYKRCVSVGMSPLNSRFGRRSKYFKVSMSASQKPVSPLPVLPPVSPFPVATPMIYPFLFSSLLHFYAFYRHDVPGNIL
ncbi:hypothetical protein Aduo_002741 [Ancylostoma duodenale]